MAAVRFNFFALVVAIVLSTSRPFLSHTQPLYRACLGFLSFSLVHLLVVAVSALRLAIRSVISPASDMSLDRWGPEELVGNGSPFRRGWLRFPPHTKLGTSGHQIMRSDILPLFALDWSH